MRLVFSLRSPLGTWALLALSVLCTGTALAQTTYPDKPLRFVVPYPLVAVPM